MGARGPTAPERYATGQELGGCGAPTLQRIEIRTIEAQ